jgi:hypothetical protein
MKFDYIGLVICDFHFDTLKQTNKSKYFFLISKLKFFDILSKVQKFQKA